MIEFVKTIIVQNECLEYGTSIGNVFTTIQDILITRWDKNCTPLYFLALSLNPRFYSDEWVNGGPSCRFRHMDGESGERQYLDIYIRIEDHLMRWRRAL